MVIVSRNRWLVNRCCPVFLEVGFRAPAALVPRVCGMSSEMSVVIASTGLAKEILHLDAWEKLYN